MTLEEKSCVQTIDYGQIYIKNNSMAYWKYSYYNQIFTNESNFGIKWLISSLYAVKK